MKRNNQAIRDALMIFETYNQKKLPKCLQPAVNLTF
jgi:hypothetical protein